MNFELSLIVILLIAQGFAYLSKIVGLPRIVGLIVAGVVIGSPGLREIIVKEILN